MSGPFEVVALREGQWTVFTVTGLGVGSQVRRTADLDEVARALIAGATGGSAGAVEIRVRFPQVEEVRVMLAQADRCLDAARAQTARSGQLREQAVQRLRDAGWTFQDIAEQLGLTYARVHLLAGRHTDSPRDDDGTDG